MVLDTLSPAERLAFVLHDIFDVPFDEIACACADAPLAATRQLASRARRRVQRAATVQDADLARQRAVVACLSARPRARGPSSALLAVLDPRGPASRPRRRAPVGAPGEVRGARAVAQNILRARSGGCNRRW